jgi:hypothetical protein
MSLPKKAYIYSVGKCTSSIIIIKDQIKARQDTHACGTYKTWQIKWTSKVPAFLYLLQNMDAWIYMHVWMNVYLFDFTQDDASTKYVLLYTRTAAASIALSPCLDWIIICNSGATSIFWSSHIHRLLHKAREKKSCVTTRTRYGPFYSCYNYNIMCLCCATIWFCYFFRNTIYSYTYEITPINIYMHILYLWVPLKY